MSWLLLRLVISMHGLNMKFEKMFKVYSVIPYELLFDTKNTIKTEK